MKIGIITSGGDAPSMNACVRAIVRSALDNNIEVCGFYRGYKGILENDIVELKRTSVSDMIQRGGTFLQTDRSDEWRLKEYRIKGAEILRQNNIDYLVVIGGDGSFNGALNLVNDTGFKVICIPATIDNDFGYTDQTLGFDTAVNNVLWAINSLRDTMQSHNKITIVEVMGRRCGDIALHSGITGGAEYILVPEVPFDINVIAEDIKKSAERGKKSNLIILAEGAGKMEEISEQLKSLSGISPRQTRLGFIQRGGSPTYKDRMLACEFGLKAIELIKNNISNKAIGYKDNKIVSVDLIDAVNTKKEFDIKLYNDIKQMV